MLAVMPVLLEDVASLAIAVLAAVAGWLSQKPEYAAYGAVLAAIAKALPSIVSAKKGERV